MTTIRTQRFTIVTEWNDGSHSYQGPFDLGEASLRKRKLEKRDDVVSVDLRESMTVIAA